jgi:hypothetical protein
LNQSKLHKFGVQDYWVIQQTITKLFHGVAGSDLVGGNPIGSIIGDPKHMLIGFMIPVVARVGLHVDQVHLLAVTIELS